MEVRRSMELQDRAGRAWRMAARGGRGKQSRERVVDVVVEASVGGGGAAMGSGLGEEVRETLGVVIVARNRVGVCI